MADVLKAKNEYLGSAAAVGYGSAVKEVEARNAQFEQTIQAKPNPEYDKMKEASDMASFKANIAKIEADKGSEAATQAGFAALGLPPATDVSRYPPNVQNAIKSVGQGQKAGVNPVTAAVALASGGVSASSPELAMTAQSVLSAGRPDSDGKIVPFVSLKPEEQEALTSTEIQAAINLVEANKKENTPIFSNEYIYGMLPPDVLAKSTHLNESQKVSLKVLTDVALKRPSAIESPRSLIEALIKEKVPPEDMPRIIADIASASVQHNNATRKYNLLGLNAQDGVTVNYDPAGLDFGRKTKLDLVDQADVQLLIMAIRIKVLRDSPSKFEYATGNPI